MTPTEELIGEVLAARLRLGETLWTFDTNVLPAAKRLEKAGLISTTHGIVEKTFRASLTEAGREHFLDAEYVAPVLKHETTHPTRGKEYALRINCVRNGCAEKYGFVHLDHMEVQIISGSSDVWKAKWNTGYWNGHMCDRMEREVLYGVWREVEG